ncbi:uncharacterized protein [Magallana gigas]|uniref:uncharacterized protein isoform X2 n=1 Tax=Magallana gigas TaxID=29159 RepID=UPI00333EED42
MRSDETQGDRGVFSISEENQRYILATCTGETGLYTEKDSHGSRTPSETLAEDSNKEMRTDETQGNQGVFSIREKNQRYVSATCIGMSGLYTERDSYGSRITNETLIEDLGNEIRTDETEGDQGVFSIGEENQRDVSATCIGMSELYTEKDSHDSRITNEMLLEDFGNEMRTDEIQDDQGVFNISEKNQRYVLATCIEKPGLYTEKDSHGSRITNEMLIEDLGNEMRTDVTQGDQGVFSISEENQRYVSATCIEKPGIYTERNSHGSSTTKETLIEDLGNEMRTDETQGDQGVFSFTEENQRYVSATCIGKTGLYTEKDSHGSSTTKETLIEDLGNEMRTDETQGGQGVFSFTEENQRDVIATCIEKPGLYTEKDSHGSRITNDMLIEDLGNEMRSDETQGDQGVFSIREENQRYVSATCTGEPGIYTEKDSLNSKTTNEMLIEDLGNEMRSDETQGDQGVFSIREENQRYVSATCTGEPGIYTEKDSLNSKTTNEMLIEDLGNEMRTDETQGDQGVFSISEENQRDVSATCTEKPGLYREKDSHGSRITNETLIEGLVNEMRTDETQGDQGVFSISEENQRYVSATCIEKPGLYREKDSHGSRITNETLIEETQHSRSIGFVSTRKYCIYDEVNAFCYAKRIDSMPVYDDYEGVFRIYLFSSKKALQTIEFIERRNLNAMFVNFV